jgi:tetratricopeptide (TPR) repeat protein
MRHATIFVLLLLFIAVTCSPGLLSARSGRNYTQFNKGVVYILIKDRSEALKYMEEFFKDFPNPALRSGFVNVIRDNSFEVTKQFGRYLDINHKSTPALVGIALSTTDMENTTSIANLQRAIRLERGFSAAYLCLGFEYMKIKNYPLARANFTRAMSLARNIPEYKLLLARLYMTLEQPSALLALMKPEADRHPENFYFNYYTAEAYFRLKQLDAMERYIGAAIEVNPRNNDAQLLQAKYLLTQKEFKRAKASLRRIRYSGYHEEYTKTFGEVLLELKDRQAKNFLDEVYSKKPWDKDINRLMGRYYLGQGAKDRVQGWINRAILCGDDPETLKGLFPGDYTFPKYRFLPFFQVKDVHWLPEDRLLVVAVLKSGDRQKIFILDSGEMKIEASLDYRGDFQQVFLSPDRRSMIFSTSDIEEGYVNVFAVDKNGPRYRIRKMYSKPLKMSALVAGFNRAGNLAYFTDKDIEARAFESPFTVALEMGEKEPIYPDYPFSIFMYNFVTGRLSLVKDIGQMENVPIDVVKKFFLVYDGYEKNSQVRTLVDKGLRLELTSSSIVKIFFDNKLTSFGIYLSDLKNAFQAQLVDNLNNKNYKIDETMFLGEGEYAELDVVDYDPEKMELVVLTKDKERRLIRFNYKSFLFTGLADKVLQSHYDKDSNTFYILTERSKKSLFTETSLAVIYFKPYLKQIVDDRRNLKQILSAGVDGVYFSTIDGELLKMDGSHQFQYAGPSFDGSVHAASPSEKKTAVFINGKLFVVNRIETSELDKWAKKRDSKK